MLGRAVIAQGNPAKVDEVVAFVREQVQPLADSLPGSMGLGMWVNRENGMVLVNSAWEDAATLSASDATMAATRREALQLLGAAEARIEILEPAVIFQDAPNEPGNWTRSTEFTAPVERMDENIALFTSEVLPAIREIPGATTVALLVNRVEGRGVATVTYASRAELDASRGRAATLREQSLTRLGARVTNVLEFEVAIVGIRPGVDLPAQGKPVEFRSGAAH